jgi:hypothetical protein
MAASQEQPNGRRLAGMTQSDLSYFTCSPAMKRFSRNDFFLF